jgi:glycosyltransferase involved in cell wall biosynthesis
MSLFISVLTPVWNRSKMLPRVLESLNKQTYKNFEWLVGNDGSTDDFQSRFDHLVARSSFPIVLIDSNIRVGKAKIDNCLIKESSGDLILWCDSDDILVPTALQEIADSWNSIPEAYLSEFIGLTAICSANQIPLLSNELPESNFYPSWNDLECKYNIKQDMVFVTRASALKNHPFPEVDYVVPERAVWTKIGTEKTIFINKILKEVEYGNPNAISFSGKMQFCRGYAYALAESYSNLRQYKYSFFHKLTSVTNFLRYSIHGDIPFLQSIELWKGNTSLLFLFMMIPGAIVLALKDRLGGKVVKTHIDFEKNIQNSIIQIRKYQTKQSQ